MSSQAGASSPADRRLRLALERRPFPGRNVRQPLPDPLAVAAEHPRPVLRRQPIPLPRRERQRRLRRRPSSVIAAQQRPAETAPASFRRSPSRNDHIRSPWFVGGNCPLPRTLPRQRPAASSPPGKAAPQAPAHPSSSPRSIPQLRADPERKPVSRQPKLPRHRRQRRPERRVNRRRRQRIPPRRPLIHDHHRYPERRRVPHVPKPRHHRQRRPQDHQRRRRGNELEAGRHPRPRHVLPEEHHIRLEHPAARGAVRPRRTPTSPPAPRPRPDSPQAHRPRTARPAGIRRPQPSVKLLPGDRRQHDRHTTRCSDPCSSVTPRPPPPGAARPRSG